MDWKRLSLFASLTLIVSLAACKKPTPKNQVAANVPPSVASSASPADISISLNPKAQIAPLNKAPIGTTPQATVDLPRTSFQTADTLTGTTTQSSPLNPIKTTIQSGTPQPTGTTAKPGKNNTKTTPKPDNSTKTGTTNKPNAKPKAPTCSELGFSRDMLMETKTFRVSICGSMEVDNSLVYLSVEKATGQFIKLPVKGFNRGIYAARDSDISYAIDDNFLVVRQGDKILVDEPVISVSINGEKVKVNEPATSIEKGSTRQVEPSEAVSNENSETSVDQQGETPSTPDNTPNEPQLETSSTPDTNAPTLENQ